MSFDLWISSKDFEGWREVRPFRISVSSSELGARHSMDDVEDGLCLSAGASVALVTSSLTLVSTFAATIFFASLFSWSYVVVSIVGSIN